MIIHMRHTLWTGISETNVNIITSATRTHAFNNNNNNNHHEFAKKRAYGSLPQQHITQPMNILLIKCTIIVLLDFVYNIMID